MLDAALGRAIGGLCRDRDGGIDGRHVDDGARRTALLHLRDHALRNRLADKEVALEIDADDAVELFFFEREEIAALRNDARIVDEDVDAVIGVGRGADEIAHIEPLADIAITEKGLAAAIGDFRGDGFARLLIDIGKDDFGALIREGMRDGAADAVRRAGHDGHFAAELGTGCHERTPCRRERAL